MKSYSPDIFCLQDFLFFFAVPLQRDVCSKKPEKKYRFCANAMLPQAPVKKFNMSAFIFYLYRSYLFFLFIALKLFIGKTPEANGSYLLCKLAESSSRHQLENIPQKGMFPSVSPHISSVVHIIQCLCCLLCMRTTPFPGG